MADRIRSNGGRGPVRGRRRGDSQRRVPVGVVRREGLTGRRLGMQQRDRSAERRAWVAPLVAVGLTAAAVAVDAVVPAVLTPVRDGAEVAFAPLQRAMVVPPTEELQAVEQERDELADQLRVEKEKRALDAAGAELFDSRVTAGRELVPARVIGFTAATASSPDRRITLDVGSRDGIEKDLTVVSAEGLVGRVTSVTSWTSEVMVLGDPELSVGVRSQDGALGVVRATAPPGTPARKGNQLTLLAFEAGTFEKGDTLTTIGGTSSPFVSGVRLGRVVKVDPDKGQLQDTAAVRPDVRVATLEVVGVLTGGERTEPRSPTTAPDPSSSSSGGSGGSPSSSSGPLDGNPSDDESVLVDPSPAPTSGGSSGGGSEGANPTAPTSSSTPTDAPEAN